MYSRFRIAYTYRVTNPNTGTVIHMQNVAYVTALNKSAALDVVQSRHETVNVTTCEEWTLG